MKIVVAIISMSFAALILSGASLPNKGPIPEPKPEAIAPSPPSAVAPQGNAAPIPQAKPQESSGSLRPEKSEPARVQENAAPQKQGPNLPQQETLEEQHLTVASESDADHSECVAELRSLGVVFQDISRIDDSNGCGIDKPLKVLEALPGIKLKPEGVFRCPVALALARWMKESVIPAAAVAAKDQGRIIAINQASSYICRLRNSAETGKISEHARGNAIDIASFSFERGPDIAVQPRKTDSTLIGAFQRTASAAGCLYFTTVLDPESDAAHETHFHLDVLERKGGFRYCH